MGVVSTIYIMSLSVPKKEDVVSHPVREWEADRVLTSVTLHMSYTGIQHVASLVEEMYTKYS